MGRILIAFVLLGASVGRADVAEVGSIPGCTFVELVKQEFRTSGESPQSEAEAKKVCNSKDKIYIFGADKLSACRIKPSARKAPFTYDFALKGGYPEFHQSYVGFCRVPNEKRLVRFKKLPVPTDLEPAMVKVLERLKDKFGVIFFGSATQAYFASETGASILVLPRDSEERDFVALLKREKSGAIDQTAIVLPAIPDAVADVDGDGFPEYMLKHFPDGPQYLIDSFKK